MAGAMLPRCEFLLANPPACDQTYAEALGSKFDTFQIIYAVVSVVLCIPTFFYTAKLVRARGLVAGLGADSQRRIFLLCSFICATLLVRSVDPSGWRKWLPIVVAGLCLDLATAAVFSLVINLVDDWTQLTLRVTSRKHLLLPVRRLFYGLHAYTWVLLLVTGAVQNSVNRIWFWRALKLVLLAILLAALSVTLAVVGLMIWRFLRRNERGMGSRQNSGSNLRKGSSAAPAAADEEIGGASTNSRSLRGSVAIRSNSRASMVSSSAKKKRSKVNRILKLLVPMLVLALLTLLLQLATARALVDDKYTRESPDEPPSSTGDILAEASFEVVQVLATLVAVYFFRPRRHRGTDSQTSDMGGGASGRSSRNGSQGPRAIGRPRQDTTTNTVSDVQLDVQPPKNGGDEAAADVQA